LKCSFTWNVVANKNIVILDGKVSEKLIPCFGGHDFFIIKNIDTLYLKPLLLAIFLDISFNLRKILFNYHLRMIYEINPRLVITFTDTSPLYWELDKKIHNQINFLTIQNAQHYVRGEEGLMPGYEHLFLSSRPYYSNLACISQFDVDYYMNNGVTVENSHKIGSLKISDYIFQHTAQKKVFDICLVTNSINNRDANIAVWKLVLKYMSSYDILVCIALKSNYDYQNQVLYDMFQNTNAVFCRRTEYSSHYLTDISEITIGFSSSLLRQSFARGNKIYPLNFSSHVFDLPYSLLKVKLSPSYNQFESHLNYLLTLDHQVYKDKNDKMMKYFDIFDLNSTPENKLKRIIQKLIQ
jgi:hypothetical protein